MYRLVVSMFGWVGVFFRSRQDLVLEILALRQQVLVLKGKNPRPTLGRFDRLFWVALRRVLDQVDRGFGRGKAGNSSELASCRVSVVLAVHFPPGRPGQTEDRSPPSVYVACRCLKESLLGETILNLICSQLPSPHTP